MGLFDAFKKKEQATVTETKTYADEDILAVANATMMPATDINDPAFSKEMLGQTVGFKLKDGNVVAPANGVLEIMFPSGHAFGIRMKDNTGILVHIGIDTVELNGTGFKILAKQGDTVKAGQPLVQIDLDKVEKQGYDCTTMLIITEPADSDKKVNFIPFGEVEKAQKINQ